jgi:hypothetical protein
MSATAAIHRIAARFITTGRAPVQPATEAPAESTAPPLDAVEQARRNATAFAARLRELQAARDAFDAAIHAERHAGKIDLATAIQCGDPLPDLGDVTANRSRAKVRLDALWQVANRECEAAGHAVHTLRVAALAEAREARGAAIRWIVDSLPPVFDRPEEIAKQARTVKTADQAIADLEKAPSMALQKAPLWGRQLPGFRLDPLPERAGVPVRDALDPVEQAADIERVMHLHGEAVRFRCAVCFDPEAARWLE